MASSKPSVQRKVFQNAHNAVEVIVRPKQPYIKTQDKKKFNRECALKSEVNTLGTKVLAGGSEKPRKLSSQRKICEDTNLETVSKKHQFLSQNSSWAEFLNDQSNDESSILSSSNNYFKNVLEKSCQTSKIYKNNVQKRTSPANPTHPTKSISTQTQTLPCKDSGNRATQFDCNSQKMKTPVSVLSIDQSPFGHSALQLLRELRERLISKGDRANSEMVNRIQAIFVTPNENIRDELDNQLTPNQETIFFKTDSVTKKITEVESQKIITEQANEIKHLEQQIKELQMLSTNLLTYHEKTMKQVVTPVPVQSMPEKELPKEDDTLFPNLDNEKQSLVVERNALLSELKKQGDLIVKLELKLREAYKEVNNQKSFMHTLPSRPPSQLDSINGQQLTRVNSGKTPLFPSESDGDSAFDEKTSSRNSRDANATPLFGKIELCDEFSVRELPRFGERSLENSLSMSKISAPSRASSVDVSVVPDHRVSRLSTIGSLHSTLTDLHGVPHENDPPLSIEESVLPKYPVKLSTT